VSRAKDRKNEDLQQPDNVTQLSQYRARLARGQRARRTDEIFASEDPPAAIRALPADEFFYLIHETGFPDAMEILAHGTAEQIQTVLDFSVWDKDQVSLDKSQDWLAALVEAPVESLGRWVKGIDVELLALLVRKRARIYDLSLEEVPEETDGALWNTPDRLFTIEMLGDPEQVRVTQRLLDSAYRYSPAMMRRLLVGMRGESDAELEEEAHRWRSGRMADLGFVDYYEALQVYQELDPGTVRIGQAALPRQRPAGETEDADHLRLPVVIAEKLSGRTPFARAVARLQSRDEVADLHYALVALCNRALSANRVTPADDEAIREILERVSATLDLAVELLARGDAEQESGAVRTIPLVTLHRLGVSLIGKLRQAATALRRRNPFASLAPGLDIFATEDGQILQSLTGQHPLFPRLLDQPPAAGERAFASLADLATATRAIERAATSVEMVRRLGVDATTLSPEALSSMAKAVGMEEAKGTLDPAAIDADVIARTVLVRRILALPEQPLALSKEAILQFKSNFNNEAQLPETAARKAIEVLMAASPNGRLDGATLEVASRWVRSLFPLGPVLGDWSPE
jgi:hypothetical protein